jgi:putative phage-type endonuclease
MTALFETPTPARRRVTPTGRLLLPADAPRDHWLKARHQGIGSSDVAAILNLGADGENRHATPLHVYYNKRGELPERDDAGEYALWGQLHEDTVAQEWARRNKSAIRRVGIVTQDGAPWRMCTLDRRVTVCPLNRDQTEACALEVKTRNAWVAGKWRRGVPDDVLAQVLWQEAVTGFKHIHVACLIGGNDFRQFTVHAVEHAGLIADITTIADRLWHEHIVPGRPPAPSGNPEALVDLYDELNPDREGAQYFDRDLDVHDALDLYLEASEDEKAAARRKDEAKAVLIEKLGNAEYGVIDGKAAFTYREASRATADLGLLAEKYPAAFNECVRDKGSRRLNITNQYRKTWGATR